MTSYKLTSYKAITFTLHNELNWYLKIYFNSTFRNESENLEMFLERSFRLDQRAIWSCWLIKFDHVKFISKTIFGQVIYLQLVLFYFSWCFSLWLSLVSAGWEAGSRISAPLRLEHFILERVETYPQALSIASTDTFLILFAIFKASQSPYH